MKLDCSFTSYIEINSKLVTELYIRAKKHKTLRRKHQSGYIYNFRYGDGFFYRTQNHEQQERRDKPDLKLNCLLLDIIKKVKR